MSNELCMSLIRGDGYLAHHGILGQKWGKRNGPPYPLDSKVSAKIKKGKNPAAKKVNSGAPGNNDVKTTEDDPHGKKVTTKDKLFAHLKLPGGYALSTAGGIALAWAKAGAVFAHPAMAAVPLIGMVHTGIAEIKNLVAKHRDKKVSELHSKSETDPKTGLKLKSTETTVKQDVKAVNPGYKDLYDNTKHNCALCAITYDMRRRGYDVSAQKAKVGYSDSEMASWYKGGKTKYVKFEQNFLGNVDIGKTTKKIQSELQSQGVGARGFINVGWKGGGGHAMAYEITDKGVRLLDPQSGDSNKNLTSVIAHSYDCSYMRTDNLEPNYDLIKKEVVR